jgi:hypothetical protein
MKIAGGKSRRSQRVLVRPAGERKPTKPSRLVVRDTIVGTLDDLDRGQQKLDEEMRTAWEDKLAGQR